MKVIQLDNAGARKVNIENTLEAMQSTVGGFIEAVTLIPGVCAMLVNEEGLLLSMKPNILASHLARQRIVGPAIVVGVNGDEFTDIPSEIARHIMIRYRTT